MTRRQQRALVVTRRMASFLPISAAIFAASSAMLLAGCGTSADASNSPVTETTIPVRVATLGGVAVTGARTIAVTGTLAGKEEVALAFKVGGVIARIGVYPGQLVRSGQVLAELRPTEIDAQVATALASRAKAERDLARVTRLHADSVATLEQLQDARTALEVASNAARAAQFNAEYAVIRAPGDGVVLARMAEPGQVVEPGRSVLSVRRHGRGMVVRVGLPDQDAMRLALGDSATVSFDALPGKVFAARVTERAATASAGSGDYAIEVTLAGAANQLPTGLVARVVLQTRVATTAARTGRVLVPLDALVDADADSAAVFVLRPDGRSVSRRTLKLTDVAEALLTAEVPVVSGLDGGETVVTAGMTRLVDGSKVRVVTTPAQPQGSDAAPKWSVDP